MTVNVEAKVHSIEKILELIRHDSDKDDEFHKTMFKFCGKTVKICEIDISETDIDLTIVGNNDSWYAWMFSDLPDMIDFGVINFETDIDGHNFGVVDKDGDFTIGCETVEASVIDQIYKVSQKIREKKPRRVARKAK